ncbi:hypothetical protein [Streptomyces sp. NPDC008150]|uniref:hypothetical protein n=1 Tax=Streptomyces sp. NPDC008150 TaxID=3364816 RepID=UPI0036E22CF6
MSEEPSAVAEAAAEPPPGPEAGTAGQVGRPGRPLLAGAALVGALLVAVPVLLLARPGGGPPDTTVTDAGQAGTVLGGDGTGAPGAAYASADASREASPSRTPSVKAEKAPVRAAPVVVSPSPSVTKSPKATAKPKAAASATAKAKPKPKDPHIGATTVVVHATRVLQAGQSVSATLARLVMQSDGNLVIYDENGKPRWASHTFGSNYHAVFQGDGNLVVYTSSNSPVWASQTPGHNGATLVLQGDGNVVIYDGSTPVWAANTQH